MHSHTVVFSYGQGGVTRVRAAERFPSLRHRGGRVEIRPARGGLIILSGTPKNIYGYCNLKFKSTLQDKNVSFECLFHRNFRAENIQDSPSAELESNWRICLNEEKFIMQRMPNKGAMVG